MKNIYTIILTTFISLNTLAQTNGVGIDTDEPTAMLDVNGEMRARQLNEGESTLDYVLSADEDGNVKQIPMSDLAQAIEGSPKAEYVEYTYIWDFLTNRTPTLDLWTKQENGEEIKRYYFLGQQQRVTLPKNITSQGDDAVRVITFILVKDPQPDGFGSSSASSITWDAMFQTKGYQETSSTVDETCIYNSETRSSSLFSSGWITTGNNCTERRIKLSGNTYVREREINFYDFGGKWIMTVNQ